MRRRTQFTPLLLLNLWNCRAVKRLCCWKRVHFRTLCLLNVTSRYDNSKTAQQHIIVCKRRRRKAKKTMLDAVVCVRSHCRACRARSAACLFVGFLLHHARVKRSRQKNMEMPGDATRFWFGSHQFDTSTRRRRRRRVNSFVCLMSTCVDATRSIRINSHSPKARW